MDTFIQHLVTQISDAFDGGLGRLILLHDDDLKQVRFGYTHGEVRTLLTQTRRTRPHVAVMGFVGGVSRSLKDTMVECCEAPDWVDYDEVYIEIAQVLNAFGRIKFSALRQEDFRRGNTVISCPPTKKQLDYICKTIKHNGSVYTEYRGWAAIEEQGDPTGRIKDYPPSGVTVGGQIYRYCLRSSSSVGGFAGFGKKSTVYNAARNLCTRGWLRYRDELYYAVTFKERQERLASSPAPTTA